MWDFPNNSCFVFRIDCIDRTPLYQILTHALANKSNTTKFTLLFSNVTEADILLREEVDELKKKYPNELDVVYILDRPDDKWKGPKGYITADLVKKHAGPASLGDKVKVFVCGKSLCFLSLV